MGSPALQVDSLPTELSRKPFVIIYIYVTESCLTLCDPMDCICNAWNSPGQNTGVSSLSLLQGIFPIQGLNPGLLPCRQILLPAEPQGKPKNTGVGSLCLLQGIFPTQESNWGLLHCRQILYELSYEGSPGFGKCALFTILTFSETK